VVPVLRIVGRAAEKQKPLPPCHCRRSFEIKRKSDIGRYLRMRTYPRSYSDKRMFANGCSQSKPAFKIAAGTKHPWCNKTIRTHQAIDAHKDGLHAASCSFRVGKDGIKNDNKLLPIGNHVGPRHGDAIDPTPPHPHSCITCCSLVLTRLRCKKQSRLVLITTLRMTSGSRVIAAVLLQCVLQRN
jgi:hypothetical protein